MPKYRVILERRRTMIEHVVLIVNATSADCAGKNAAPGVEEWVTDSGTCTKPRVVDVTCLTLPD